jgi:TIR domain/SIR2-like domain
MRAVNISLPSVPEIAGGWKETDWDKLLINIEDGTVVPIIGRDLLSLNPNTNEKPILLYNYIATRLLEKLAEESPTAAKEEISNPHLNDAVGICMRYGQNHFDICYSILEIFKEVSDWPLPVPLTQLAEITDFRLFVSTTFDGLLEKAIESNTAGGVRRRPAVFAYDPKPPSGKTVEDLPLGERTIERPIVYHLMGKLQANSSNAVISDEDLLEFVCALYSENKQRVPINLLNEFSKSHLLLLGCSFSDWLARFFLRAAKRRRLSNRPDDERLRNIVEYVVDEYAPQDKNLVLFLEQFWTSTRIFRSSNVVGFVNELRRRWGERNPNKLAGATLPASEPAAETERLPTTMPAGVIFISYAREDRAAVERLRASLSEFPIWFDQTKLEMGDDWERKIEDNIARCRFFMPIISRTTNSRLEGFFRREWNQAADRTRAMSDECRFILPVSIDGTKATTARVPKPFLRAHWWQLADGEVTPEFCDEIRALFSSEKPTPDAVA